jgi:N6-adenosine-specific RNA methylase IME4
MKKYEIVYSDPPWDYEQRRLQGAAGRHYRTMNTEDICRLPVSEITAKDSILFLWATFPQLPEAFRVIKAWGYIYKTVGFVWLKKNKKADSWFFGLGFWTRGNCEICLIATKGHPKRKSAGVSQLIVLPVERHSKKPDITREKIVTLMGDLPRIELFARERTPGWDAWGNEVDADIDLSHDSFFGG